jgi:hypothetical protein
MVRNGGSEPRFYFCDQCYLLGQSAKLFVSTQVHNHNHRHHHGHSHLSFEILRPFSQNLFF